MSRLVRKPTLWFLTRLYTNRAVQPQKKTARSMEFCIYEEEGLYYECGESKCADQIRCHHEADPHLCFRTCKVLVFSKGGSCFCPPPFRRKAEGHSFWLSVLPSVHPSVRPSVRSSFRPSFRPPIGVCTLCAQLLQFYSDSFETLQMSSSCFEDVHVVWI